MVGAGVVSNQQSSGDHHSSSVISDDQHPQQHHQHNREGDDDESIMPEDVESDSMYYYQSSQMSEKQEQVGFIRSVGSFELLSKADHLTKNKDRKGFCRMLTKDDVHILTTTVNALLGVSIFAMPWGFMHSGLIGKLASHFPVDTIIHIHMAYIYTRWYRNCHCSIISIFRNCKSYASNSKTTIYQNGRSSELP